MPSAVAHRVIEAGPWRLPPPFSSLAVRSEDPARAGLARAPYARLHVVQPAAATALAWPALSRLAWPRFGTDAALDVDHAPTDWDELDACAPAAGGLAPAIATALQATGVLGTTQGAYRDALASRVDFLATQGAGFHNDVARHWPCCLFWLLVLQADDVELVLPHAGVRWPLTAGELLVFDPALAHGLCRPRDAGQALEASFAAAGTSRQLFITGELLLDDDQWAALGAPWIAQDTHETGGALDLLLASFDERTGAVQRLQALRQAAIARRG